MWHVHVNAYHKPSVHEEVFIGLYYFILFSSFFQAPVVWASSKASSARQASLPATPAPLTPSRPPLTHVPTARSASPRTAQALRTWASVLLRVRPVTSLRRASDLVSRVQDTSTKRTRVRPRVLNARRRSLLMTLEAVVLPTADSVRQVSGKNVLDDLRCTFIMIVYGYNMYTLNMCRYLILYMNVYVHVHVQCKDMYICVYMYFQYKLMYTVHVLVLYVNMEFCTSLKQYIFYFKSS